MAATSPTAPAANVKDRPGTHPNSTPADPTKRARATAGLIASGHWSTHLRPQRDADPVHRVPLHETVGRQRCSVVGTEDWRAERDVDALIRADPAAVADGWPQHERVGVQR